MPKMQSVKFLSVCLVCMFLIETKTARRILTKLGTIILHTPGQVIVYLGIPTGTGISGKILLYEKSKPLKLDALNFARRYFSKLIPTGTGIRIIIHIILDNK